MSRLPSKKMWKDCTPEEKAQKMTDNSNHELKEHERLREEAEEALESSTNFAIAAREIREGSSKYNEKPPAF